MPAFALSVAPSQSNFIDVDPSVEPNKSTMALRAGVFSVGSGVGGGVVGGAVVGAIVGGILKQ